MTKEVACPTCQGHGFVSHFGENSVWSEQCSNCSGTGTVKEPMTNADKIRAMSDEELADAMCRNPIFNVCDAVCKRDCKAVSASNDMREAVCKRAILDWLQQPAKEDT